MMFKMNRLGARGLAALVCVQLLCVCSTPTSSQSTGGNQQPAPHPRAGTEQPTPQPRGGNQQPTPQPRGGTEQPAPQPRGGNPQPAPQPRGGNPQPAPQSTGGTEQSAPQPTSASVDTDPPVVRSVSISLAPGVAGAQGSSVFITVSFSEPVTVSISEPLDLSKTPSLTFTIGSGANSSRTARYHPSASTTASSPAPSAHEVVFSYLLTTGDAGTIELPAATRISLPQGASIKDLAGNPFSASSALLARAIRKIKVDEVAISPAPGGSVDARGEVVITVTFSEMVTVTEIPVIPFDIVSRDSSGRSSRSSHRAEYLEGGGSSTLRFSCAVGDLPNGGIELTPGSRIRLENYASIKNTHGAPDSAPVDLLLPALTGGSVYQGS